MTEVTVETVEYTAQENRRYAREQANKAVYKLYGRSGLDKAGKVQQMKDAQEALTKAQEALAKAIEQAEAAEEAETDEQAADEAAAEEYQVTN